MTRAVIARLSLTLALLASPSRAQGLPPWVPEGRLPVPEEARSVEFTRADEPLFQAPNATAPRRGAVARGARLPLLAAAAGPGCRSDFFLVGPLAWVCGDGVRVSDVGVPADGAPALRTADGMPHDYFFVGKDGAFGYRELESAGESTPAREFQTGFAVSVVRSAAAPSGDPFGLTTKGLWLPLRDLGRVKPLTFQGFDIENGKVDRGWVLAETAPVLSKPGGPRIPGRVLHRFDTIAVLEVRDDHDRTFVRVADGAWADLRDLRVPTLATRPDDAAPAERWIDVDVATQVLVAYEGDTPVFATLVSTGIGLGTAATATPLGVHRVWVKLRASDMTNLEEPEAEHYYAMEEVPWVLFFEKGYGLHGAFWHRSFGHPRSHGCVNLTPLDARRIFEWASPHLPAAWTAVLPTEYDRGTIVRVR